MTIFPAAVAVNVVIVVVPTRFNVPVAELTNVPAQESAVVTDTVVEFVNVAPIATESVPVTLKFSVELNPLVLLTFTLLKPSVAVVVPVIDVAAGTPGELKFIVDEVVNDSGAAADVLMIQLPAKLCVNEVPILNVAVP